MFWLSPSASVAKKVSTQYAEAVEPARPDPPPVTATATEPEKDLSRDDLADKDLQEFLDSISADLKPEPAKKPIYTRLPRTSSSSSSTTTQSQTSTAAHETPDLPLSELLLPKEMSCRAAFDGAFYCSSFGGHFTHLYRYGEMRSCSEHWDDFWFCMRTRGYSGKAKEEAIRAHYREKERRKYGRDEDGHRRESSENVWRERTRPVDKGSAFRAQWPQWEDED